MILVDATSGDPILDETVVSWGWATSMDAEDVEEEDEATASAVAAMILRDMPGRSVRRVPVVWDDTCPVQDQTWWPVCVGARW